VDVKNAVFWDLCRVALVRTDVSEERIASIIRVTRIGELGTTLPVTSNRSTLRYTVDGGARATRRNIIEDDILQSPLYKPQILHSINRLGSVAET
jgi:hypothetical protein